MKVLAIGNSFACDATRYLHQMAKEDGEDIKVISLFIGACTLRKHYINALEDNSSYEAYFNGDATGFNVSIKEALINDEWDVVTIQQHFGVGERYRDFSPYMRFLTDYIKTYAPAAKIYLHQTWAYTDESSKAHGYKDHADMFKQIAAVYADAEQKFDIDGILPSGEVMNRLRLKGVKILRDDIHASLGVGRYALGLTWYSMLMDKDAASNTFIPGNSFTSFEEGAAAEEIAAARETAAQVIKEYKRR